MDFASTLHIALFSQTRIFTHSFSSHPEGASFPSLCLRSWPVLEELAVRGGTPLHRHTEALRGPLRSGNWGLDPSSSNFVMTLGQLAQLTQSQFSSPTKWEISAYL